MPTDTIYGIVGKATDTTVVERIYALRKRDINKPCIILIGDISELEKFSVILSEEQKTKLKKYWFTSPKPESEGGLTQTSIVFDCPDEKFAYLHRGTKTLAFRMPHPENLRNLLKETGPLIAPSANTEGMPPASTIAEAKKYFGDAIDMYVDGGEVEGQASKVIKLNKDGSVLVLRH